MNILYIGDVMGEPGIKLVEKLLPGLRNEKSIDLVIAQAENTTEGKGISLTDFTRLKKAGVDFCSGGNHSLDQPEIIPSVADPNQPIIRPANYPADTPGLGYKYISTTKGRVLVVSLLGQIVGRDADKPVDNPLLTIDRILAAEKNNEKVAMIVNFHGDFSSEKVVIGYYLDGKVTAVIGDHWHVPTADAYVLPKGTAHITDVGMCGALDASLGVKLDIIISRWHDGHKNRNLLETAGRMQFNAVLIDADTETGLASNIEHIQKLL
jgi:metallophosphoesterase (TIGR00282 family)